MSDDLDPLRQLRPDRIEPDDPGDPAVYTRAKERFMSTIDETYVPSATFATPDVYPRLAYNDELAAVEYLTRVFQFVEEREARLEFNGNHLCWLRMGTGMVMLGHANVDVHLIHSQHRWLPLNSRRASRSSTNWNTRVRYSTAASSSL